MLLSKLITTLETIKAKHGDLPIAFKDEKLGWVYTYDTHSIETTSKGSEIFALLLYRETHDY